MNNAKNVKIRKEDSEEQLKETSIKKIIKFVQNINAMNFVENNLVYILIWKLIKKYQKIQ